VKIGWEVRKKNDTSYETNTEGNYGVEYKIEK